MNTDPAGKFELVPERELTKDKKTRERFMPLTNEELMVLQPLTPEERHRWLKENVSTKERLARHLGAAGLHDMAYNARQGLYSDFESPYATPKIELVNQPASTLPARSGGFSRDPPSRAVDHPAAAPQPGTEEEQEAVSDPYKIDGPALIQFSGGRSSGFMLRKILDAGLQEDVRVTFCNTGLEHAKTYEFIEKVEREWGVPVHWLEYRHEGGHRFVEVRPETASKKGEPFEALIRASNYLPNPVTRKCTADLKVRTSQRYAKSLGLTAWTNVIGLRADEPRRVSRMRGDIKAEAVAMPMALAGHTLADVRTFWSAHPFDLELPGDDSAFGNCVGCFLKSRARLQRVMRKEPEHFEWWTRMEALALALASKPSGAVFRSDRPNYAAQLEIARTQGVMFEEEESLPCMCTD